MREAVIFDTEFTAWDGSQSRRWTAPGEFREILQIGAIVVEADTLEEQRAFSVLVRPTLNPVLSPYIVSLTGITQAAIDQHSLSLADAVAEFLAFAQDRPLCCYGDDGWVIAKNLQLVGRGALWPSGLRARDIGRWFTAAGFDVRGLNSGHLAKALGLTFDAAAHDALNDCRSIAAAIRALVQRGAPNPFASRSVKT
jgi:inhibitor of KinA sporulation pathway (predicted exonuclease)